MSEQLSALQVIQYLIPSEFDPTRLETLTPSEQWLYALMLARELAESNDEPNENLMSITQSERKQEVAGIDPARVTPWFLIQGYIVEQLIETNIREFDAASRSLYYPAAHD